MKRKLFGTLALLLVCTLAMFGFAACGNGGSDHLHSYVEVVSEEYLKSEATCKSTAVYYKSCSECGIKGKGTFTYGESVAHNYKDGTCIWCGKKGNTESRLEEADRLKYTLSEDETYYIVTGIGLETRTAFAVPSTYNGKPVKEIGYKAFYDEYYLRRIEIPDSVTSIGEHAFWSCSSLRSIEIPAGVTSIGDWAFSGCYRLVEVYNRSSLTIKAGSSGNGYVGYYALNVYTDSEGGSKLTEDENGYVIYTEGEEKILVGYHGTKKDLALPSGITTIYDRAFYKCISLTSIEIPDSVTSIGDDAFAWCNLTSIVIPDSVTSIGREVFSYCRSLTSIELPDSVTSIGDEAFKGCSSLRSVTFGENSTLTSIGDYAFWYCDSLKSVTFGENSALTIIGWAAFSGCSSLESIEIPDSVTSIGSYAFSGCSSLTEMTIPFVGENKDGTGQTYFGYIFGASVPNSLKKVTITSATSIDESAFYECASLTSVVISDSVTSIGDDAFNCCSGLTSVMIGNGVTSIGNYAFFGCTSLTSVTIGNSVSSIGGYAFFLCTSLTSIELPDSVTSIGDAAFYCCSSLRSVTFGENSALTSIGGCAFSGCSSLTSIEIPAGVTSIGSEAFNVCYNLKSIYYTGSAEDWDKISIGSYNYKLTSATRYYYSESEPSGSGNYWHYDENGEIVVW